MSVQNKTVIYPLCTIYKGDVLSNTSRISYSREIVIGKVGDDIIYKKHGKGIHYDGDGRTYEGHWKNGKKHGYGILKIVDSGNYEGQWKDGK